MASAILRIDQQQQCCNYIPNRELHEAVKRYVSLPRENVPPQLPQLPLGVWQAFWDDFAWEYAEYSIYAKQQLCFVPKDASPAVEKATCAFCTLVNMVLPISFCGVCRLNQAAEAMYKRLLEKHRPLLAAHGIGLDINIEIRSSQNGSHQTKNGFVLTSAAVASAAAAALVVGGVPVAAPIVAAPAVQEMGRCGPATVVPVTTSATDRLIELKSLLDQGLISESEFAEKKRDILSSL